MGQLWEVRIRPRVDKLILGMRKQERQKMDGAIDTLKVFGPHLERRSGGRDAHALKGSRYSNLKELIVRSGKSAWRFAYYVDKNQVVHILAGGDKRGVSKKVFYDRLIAMAEREIDAINRGE